MKFKSIHFLFFLILCITLSACQTPSSPPNDTTSAFSTLANTLFTQWVQTDTLNLHYKLTTPSAYNIDTTNISLGSFSPNTLKEQYIQMQEHLKLLHQLDYKSLSSDQQFSYNVLEDFFTTQLKLEPFLLYDEPLGSTLGVQSQLPILLSEYTFREETDIQNYFLLLECVDDYFLSILDFEQSKKDAGLFMDDCCLQSILNQCRSFCFVDATTFSQHILVASFNERMKQLPFTLSKEQQYLYEEQNEELVHNIVLPAYAMLANGLEQLKGSCEYPGGLCQKPNGQAYYNLLVYTKTGSSKTVPTLFEQTKQRISQNLLTVTTLYQNHETLSQQFHQYAFSLTDPADTLRYLKNAITNDFPTSMDTSFTIKYVSKTLSPFTSPAFYLIPPIDEQNQNIIYLNPSTGLEDHRLFPILAHEGYPGHLYQHTWFSSVNPYPIRELLSYPGYSEGWATYSELYAYTLEPSFSNEFATFLVAMQEATLGIYALMDMGIHYYGWELSQLQQAIESYFGISDESIAQQMYTTFLETPANYLSYYIGYVELLELRDYAMKTWGETFTLKNFHETILTLGPAPFSLLKEQI